MINYLKKVFLKKNLVGFIVLFLSVIFMVPTLSVSALGETIPPVFNYPFNDDFIKKDVFTTSYYEYPYIDEYNQLMNYYNTYLKDTYKNYIIYAPTVNWTPGVGNFQKPFLLFFNSDDVVSDFYLLMDGRYNVANTYIKLDFNKKPSRLSFDTNGNIVVDIYYNTSWGFQSYLSLSDFANFSYMIETNFDRPLILSSQSYNKTIIYKEQLYNPNDIILSSLSMTQSQSYIFNLDGDVFKNNIYKGLVFYFKRPKDGILKFKFDLIENDEDKPSFDFVPAFDLSFLNLAETLEKIKNCEYDPEGFGGCFTGPGGTFGGGGGGGRFGDEDDYCGIVDFTTLPEIVTQMTSEYGIFYMLACEEHKNMTPSDFKTTQIKITTNAQVFLTYKELEEEFFTNPPDWFDWNDPEFDYDDDKLKQPTSLFKIVNQYLVDSREVINEIGKTVDEVFQGLNSEIKNFIIAIYSLLILSAIMVMIRR